MISILDDRAKVCSNTSIMIILQEQGFWGVGFGTSEASVVLVILISENTCKVFWGKRMDLLFLRNTWLYLTKCFGDYKIKSTLFKCIRRAKPRQVWARMIRISHRPEVGVVLLKTTLGFWGVGWRGCCLNTSEASVVLLILIRI